MKITVTGITDTPEGPVVDFTSTVGTARGLWQGDIEAGLGSFDVEIEVPHEVREWHRTDPGVFHLTGEDPGKVDIKIQGTLESIGDDCVNAVKVSSDIILMETAAKIPDTHLGEGITFSVPSIHLYPYVV